MIGLSVQQQFEQALRNQQAGQLTEAEAGYRQILSIQAQQPDALHMLGLVAAQCGRTGEAIELLQQAIAIKPAWPEALSNLGEVLRMTGQHAAAIATLRQAIASAPNYINAYCNLALALNDAQLWDEAIACCQQALVLQPHSGRLLKLLGVALLQTQRYREAIDVYRAALAQGFNQDGIYSDLGVALSNVGETEQAIAAFRHAVFQQPDSAGAHNNLGVALSSSGDFAAAAEMLRRAISLQPDSADAYCNLGNALAELGDYDEAIPLLWRALELDPGNSIACCNLSNSLHATGRGSEAIVMLRESIARGLSDSTCHSNLVLSLHFDPQADSRAISMELNRWNTAHAQSLNISIAPHLNERSPERRLRIGYLSPDFRAHPVGMFLLPLLENHHRENFEIYAYAQVVQPDAITARLRASTTAWRSIVGLSDASVAELIRADQIDILVDLAMHTANNRLLVLARKPAPIQVNYLAYVGSSGLSTIDYRFSDPYLDPPGTDESCYQEQTIRLPETYWCYQPIDAAYPPALARRNQDGIRFGCLNNFCKVNDPLIVDWAQILGAVPQSSLLLHAPQGEHRRRLLERFVELGVASERVTFVGKMPRATYFETYQTLDIALDTTPYGGGTTTCDSLWMGVPVVTLAGERAVGRGGVSILKIIGLPELIAPTREEYIRIAVSLARDRGRLQELRASLRPRMQASPLMNAPRFARHVEEAYRRMWRKWVQD